MRGMIQLVQAAKSTPLCCKEERIADFLAQMQTVVWHTTLLGLVGTQCTHSTPSTTYGVNFKRAFCHFLVSPGLI